MAAFLVDSNALMEWKPLMRQLGLSESDIYSHEENWPRNIKQQFLRAVHQWWETNKDKSDQWKAKVIRKALRAVGQKLVSGKP